jgi:Ca2+-binding RTX toxin-like protein
MLENGTASAQDIAIRILDGATGTDAEVIENKVEAAQQFTDSLDTTDEILAYQGDAAAAAGRAYLNQVTADDATIPTQEETDAAIDDIETGGDNVISDTFVLTSGADFADQAGSVRNDGNVASDFKFTSDNELVIATNATVTGGDSLSDASNDDQDVFQYTDDSTANRSLQTVTNIENVDIRFSNGGGGVGFGGVTGAQTITLSGVLAAAATLNNLAGTGVTVVDGSELTSVNNGFSASFAGATGTTERTLTGSGAGDSLEGANGNDTINGGGGGDTINGGAGADTLNGEAGDDVINAGSGNDTVTGGEGADTLNGEAGNDSLDGGAGNDTINGGAGNDTILGGAGNDTINTGTGINTVTAGAGTDAITLDGELDIVVFEATASANGNDTINGFDVGTGANGDKLDFSAFLGEDVSYIEVADADATAVDNFNAVDYNVLVLDNAADLANIEFGTSSNYVVISDNGVSTQVNYITTNEIGEVSSNNQVATLAGIADATTLDPFNII